MLIAACASSYPLMAQNYKEDMQKIRTVYKSQYHSFSIKYLYYPYDSVRKVTDSIKGICVVDSEFWYYKIKSSEGEVEYLKNGKYFVEVNHANKVVMVANNSVAQKRDLWNISKVDSLLRLPTLKIIYAEKGKEGEYTVTLSDGNWNKMKLVFNKERYTLDEIWLYSSAQGKILGEPYKRPVIGILYGSYSKTVPSKNDFDEKKYVQKTNDGHFQTVGTFKTYKLLDYVNKRT